MRDRTSASDIESEVKFPRDASCVRFDGCAEGLLGQEVAGILPCMQFALTIGSSENQLKQAQKRLVINMKY